MMHKAQHQDLIYGGYLVTTITKKLWRTAKGSATKFDDSTTSSQIVSPDPRTLYMVVIWSPPSPKSCGAPPKGRRPNLTTQPLRRKLCPRTPGPYIWWLFGHHHHQKVVAHRQRVGEQI